MMHIQGNRGQSKLTHHTLAAHMDVRRFMVNAGKDQIGFAYLGNVVQSIRKPLRHHTATARKVQTGGLVKFKQQRIQLDLPKGTYVVVLREGQDYLFYLGDQVVFRMTGQEKCHPCI